MTLFVYFSQDKPNEFVVPREKGIPVYLRANDDHTWTFSLDEGAQEYCAQLLRADNGFYALIVCKENDVKVNDVKIFGLRVLRNADKVQVGKDEICFYEWVYQELTSGSLQTGTECPFCRMPFAVGDQIIMCPRCDTPLHDYCWESRKGPNEGCVLPNCGYIVPKEEPYRPARIEANSLKS
jgi:hypothetical protein